MQTNIVNIETFTVIKSRLSKLYTWLMDALAYAEDQLMIGVENICCVYIELKEDEWNFGRKRNALGTRTDIHLF